MKRTITIVAVIGLLLGALFIPSVAVGDTELFGSAEQAIGTLQTGLTDISTRVSVLEQDVPPDYSADIAALYGRVTALEEAVGEIQATLAALGAVLNPQ